MHCSTPPPTATCLYRYLPICWPKPYDWLKQMHISWESGESVQERIAAKWHVSYLCIITVIIIIIISEFMKMPVLQIVIWYIFFPVVDEGLLRNVSIGSRTIVKWFCCSGWNRLLVAFPLEWTAIHTAEEVRRAWTSYTRKTGRDFNVSSPLNPLKHSCNYKCNLSCTQKNVRAFYFCNKQRLVLWAGCLYNRGLTLLFCEAGTHFFSMP
jgi:hypothetical protein